MKKILSPYLIACLSFLSMPAFSQVDTTNKLGLAGDGLDLYAVLDVFQNSKTIEAFEKSLNDSKTKINNLDLDLDKKVDFIKVVTEKKEKNDDSYMFILRVDVSKTESQDVAVILLDRDKDKKVNLQIVGDEELYGKDYVIEPKGNSSITPNPAYKGPDPVTVTVEAQPTTVVVQQQAPIVQYVYSPAYVPYYPPYYYGYTPGWFMFSAVVSFGFYAGYHNHYHGGYYGGHYGGNNNIIINNGDQINHYRNSERNTSNRVSDNQNRGNYGNGKLDHGRGGGASSTRPSASTRPSTSNRQSPSASTRQSPSTSNRQSPSASTRQSPSTSNRSSNFNSPSTSNRSSGSYGGGRSMGGGARAGGGGGRRR